MTHKEAARILDPETSAKAMREYGEGNAQIAACDEACRIAADVLRNNPTGEPLTVEQLRDMVDQPAYLYIYDTALNRGWHIIKAVTEDKIIFRGCGTVYVPISSLGKCFDLYAYLHAYIDREAWEPCLTCNTCASCKYSIDSAFRTNSKCFECEHRSNYEARKFCPDCGRPLTEEAWAELEKRLRG